MYNDGCYNCGSIMGPGCCEPQGFFEFIVALVWGLLPDRCAQPGCARRGALGNENRRADGSLSCDDCDAAKR
jgi:hypothetical protein